MFFGNFKKASVRINMPNTKKVKATERNHRQTSFQLPHDLVGLFWNRSGTGSATGLGRRSVRTEISVCGPTQKFKKITFWVILTTLDYFFTSFSSFLNIWKKSRSPTKIGRRPKSAISVSNTIKMCVIIHFYLKNLFYLKIKIQFTIFVTVLI